VDLFRPFSRVRPSLCTPVTPAMLYLLLGLQDVQWAVGNSRGAHKLAWTPHVNKKKKKRDDQKEDSLQFTEYMFINNLDSWKTRHANRCWMDGEALLLMFAVPWACWSCRQERARMTTRRLNRAISRRKLHADSS